ncbi:cytochrome c oxidase assembly factor Coa1 family protein [Flavobacterium branchiarum]|uniref:Cytochrome c oxidase assembly factor Coa1 family protein n=1 Tax=Flavobacterium branchiarum TaxID=1114870 RepID=A0ABV5FK01_9FLAO|nr:cytochrome c oxidase assembly factor Coa1 family protein [Flavobacterium branchiarum]MDN3672458.1 cytochrome c oxidase assembly factor Coa1 family protein [Flavobacterium branchiarum]
MNNKLITKNSWWKRNWKWFLPSSIVFFFVGIGLALSLLINGNIDDYAQAYSDTSLYEKAIEKAKINDRVKDVLGDLEPIDNLAILEGDAKYSNNGNCVDLTIRVKGNKGKGKMDISAIKNGTEWEYKKINIRTKLSKETIEIIKTSL